MKHDDPQLIDALAAEYVLGTLRGPARRRFERWLAESWHIERRVHAWEERFVHLALGLEPIAPSRQTWRNIEKRTMAATPSAAARRIREPRQPWLAQWRALAASVVLFALLAAGGIFIWRADLFGGMPTLATINAADGETVWRIEVAEDLTVLRAVAVNRAVIRPDESLELWALPDDGSAPVSLGVLPESGALERPLTRTQQAALRASKRVAVSLEPRGGSPTGAPTGPVLFLAERTAEA